MLNDFRRLHFYSPEIRKNYRTIDYNEYCFMPLHVYEGLSGRLIITILKPGKRSDGKRMLSVVKRMIGYLRRQWPETLIVFRGDSHSAYPEVTDYIEQTDMTMYVTGLSANSVLKKEVKQHVDRAEKEYMKRGEKVTLPTRIFSKTGKIRKPGADSVCMNNSGKKDHEGI